MPTESFPSFDDALPAPPNSLPKFEDALDAPLAPPVKKTALDILKESNPDPIKVDPVALPTFENASATPVPETETAIGPYTPTLADKTRSVWKSIRDSMSPLIGQSSQQIAEDKAAMGPEFQKMSDSELLNAVPGRRLQQKGLFPLLWDFATSAPVVGDKLGTTMVDGREMPMIPHPTAKGVADATGLDEKGVTAKVTAGLGTGVESLATFFASPLGVATLGTGSLPIRAQQGIGLAFSVDMGMHLPAVAKNIVDAIQNDDLENAVRYGVEGAGMLYGTAHGVKGALSSKQSLLSQRLASELDSAGMEGVPSMWLKPRVEDRSREQPVTAPDGVSYTGEFPNQNRAVETPAVTQRPTGSPIVEGAVQPGNFHLAKDIVDHVTELNLPGFASRVVFSEDGPAISSRPTEGAFDALHINLNALSGNLAALAESARTAGKDPDVAVQDYLRKAVQEEAVHNAGGRALYDEWSRTKPDATFDKFYDQRHTEIHDEMTPAQRAKVVERYGSPLSPVATAEEHIRQMIQDRIDGRQTEDALALRNQPTTLAYLKSVWLKLKDWVQSITDGGLRSRTAQQMNAIQSILSDAKSEVDAGAGERIAAAPAPRRPSPVDVLPTERDIARLGQAGRVVAQLPGVRSFVDKVTADPDLERVARNPFVKRHLIEPVMEVRDSEAKLSEPAATYMSLKADPTSTPAMISHAAGRALNNIESFNGARAKFNAKYNASRARMVSDLNDVIGEKVEAVTARDAASSALDVIRETGRRDITESIAAKRRALSDATLVAQRGAEIRSALAEDTAALKAFQKAMGQSQAVKNVLEFVMSNIDLSATPESVTKVARPTKKRGVVTVEPGKPITSAAGLIDAMKLKALNSPDKTFEQAVGAPMDTISTIARIIVASEPIRAQLEANRDTFGKPVEPFRELRRQIGAEMKAGDVKKAARLLASGVGKTAVERAESAKLARVLGAREKRLLESIQALDQSKAAIDGVADSGEFRSMATQVYDDLNVREVMVSQEGATHVLKGIREGEPDVVISYDPSKLNADKTLTQLRDYKDRALSYLADPTAPGYDPARAAGLKEYLRQYEWMADPSMFPQRGKFLPGLATAVPRTIFGVLGQIDQIPRFVLTYGAGFAANHAHRTLTAYATAKEVTLAKYFDHLARLQGTLSAALKSHNDMHPDDYRVNVLNPLAASRQDFRTARLASGYSIGNGHFLTAQDMNYFATLLEYEHALIDRLNATASENFSVIADNPNGILYMDANGKPKYRLPFETGPNTTNRRAEKAVTWARKWAGLDHAGRERFVDEHLNDLLFGYYSDAGSPVFGYHYAFEPEFKEIIAEAKAGSPIESLDDLVQRTYDRYIGRAEEPTSPALVKARIMGDIGSMLKRIGDEDTAGVNKSKVKIMAYGGENSFNTERGRQVIPSLWYDYGEVTAPEHAAFMNSALSKFAIEHLNSIEALDTALKDTVTKFSEQVGAGRAAGDVKAESRARQLSGDDFYTWDQARTASNQVSDYLTKLRAALGFQKRASLIEANMDTVGQSIAQAVTTSMLSGPQANAMNSFGGALNIVLFDRAIRNHTLIAALGRTAWHEGLRAVREVVSLLAHEGNPVGRRIYSLLRHAETIPLAGRVAESLGRTIDGMRTLYDQGRRDGIILNKDLAATIDSMLLFKEMGGVVEGRPPITAAGRLVKRGETRLRTFTKRIGQASVGYVDARVNAATFRLAQEMMKDLENRGWRYLELRDSATPFGDSDFTNPNTQLSHRELVGGRIPDADVEQASVRIRQFLRDRAGINLDSALLDYWRRRKAETVPGAERLFSDDQMRQIRMGMASWLNLADFSNRPIVTRTNRTFHNLGLFLGYPAHEMALLLSLGNRLSTRTWLRGRVESLPLVFGMVAAATIVGSLGQGTAERLKRLVLDRESTAPTIFNSNNPAQIRDALVSGFSSMVPFYGSLVNNVTGNGLRNGFDLNSQIVLANVASDTLKTVKEMYQSGDATVPLIRLSERYVFPVNYLARFFPQYEGLREIANDRNLLIRNSKDAGLEALVRPPDASPVRYTPVSPLLNEFANAVGKGDIPGAQAAYQKVVAFKAQEGSATPEADALKAVQSRNPIAQVFKERPSDEQLQKIMGNMAPEDRDRVQRTLTTFNNAVQAVGGNEVNFTKAASGSSSGGFSGFGGGGGSSGRGRTRRVGRSSRVGRRISAKVGRTRRAPSIRVRR